LEDRKEKGCSHCDQHCMLLADSFEPPPSMVVHDVQYACLSLLYLCGYCESANLVEFSSGKAREEGAREASGPYTR
jgi:hypothetical protein